MDAVATHALRKSYGPREVLHGIDLRVPAGSLFGFLGPNGAGKTTTIRILLGLLRASGGEAMVLGQDSWRRGPSLRAGVGYLPGDARLYDHLTGRATLDFFSAARRVRAAHEIKRLADAFDLDLDRRVRDYSRGMKQKLGLIQAMMHRPKLLVLDEPTIALDPLVRHTLHEELQRVAGEGRTVLFSSHTLSEVEDLCDWVGILRAGRLIEQQKIAELRARALRHVEIVFADGAQLPAQLPNGLTVTRRSPTRLAGRWIGPTPELLAWLASCPVKDVIIAPPDLEDLFLHYYAADAPEVRS
jgi:ABC-2 type transport system ATP-binding protein